MGKHKKGYFYLLGLFNEYRVIFASNMGKDDVTCAFYNAAMKEIRRMIKELK